jgi:UPF0716 protein FxsA
MFVAMQYLASQFSCTAKKSYPSLVCYRQIGILNPGGFVMPLIIFMLVPIIEMWILIEVGGWIGALPTIGLVVLTATLGLSLLKRQGLSTLMSARRKMDEGSIPASELVSGVMIGVGGALLLTPGFVTDAIGFALLMPQARQWLLIKLIDRYHDKIVIESEFQRVDDRNF